MIVLILAGGNGTRLWPLSYEGRPKQFLALGNSSHTLLQQTVLRFASRPGIAEIAIITQQGYEGLVREQITELSLDKPCIVLLEPAPRNTAPAIAFALNTLQTTHGVSSEETVCVVPSDHVIEPESLLLETLQHLQPQQHIVLFGISPTRPETGFGYIELAERHDSLTYRILRFTEKPDLEQARAYLESGRFYWNAGIFLFSIETFWREMDLHAPGLLARSDAISIDYALLEKSSNLLVCPLPIAWSDVGSWDSVYDLMPKDSDNNATTGTVIKMNSSNNLILAKNKPIAAIGISDLFIIDTPDALLIGKRGESQFVKHLSKLHIGDIYTP